MSTRYTREPEVNIPYKTIGTAICLIFLTIVAWKSYVTVDAGHVGVVKRFGAVTGDIFKPGLHWKLPIIETVEDIDTRISSIDAAVSAGSADQQVVKGQVAVQYFLVPIATSSMVDSLGDREDLEKAILENAIQESFKAVTARFTAEELLTKRPEVKSGTNKAVENYIETALKEKKLDGLVRVANIGVKNIEFSDKFNDAIEAKVEAQQEALKAEAEKTKKITEAQAEAESKKLRAEAEAYKTLAEAEARAKAINKEGEALAKNPNIVKLRLAERWDGVLPRVNSGVLPFLKLDEQGN